MSNLTSYGRILLSRSKDLAYERIKIAEKEGIDINDTHNKDNNGCTALMLASQFDHDDQKNIVKFLIKKGEVLRRNI